MQKSIKLRIYPNSHQREIIDRTLRGCSFVWNKYIEANDKKYLESGEFITWQKFSNELTKLKMSDERYMWLNGISTKALQHALQDCYKAYVKFFKGNGSVGKPKFKSKKLKNQYRSFFIIKDGINLYDTDPTKPNTISLPILHNIRCPRKYLIPDKSFITSGRIMHSITDKYYLYITYEYYPERDNRRPTEGCGISLGIDTFATVYYEDFRKPTKYANFIHDDRYKDYDRRINKLQSVIRKKAEINYERLIREYQYTHSNQYPDTDTLDEIRDKAMSSNNIKKVVRKLRKLYEKRTNYGLNKLNHIINDLTITKPSYIIIEDIPVKELTCRNISTLSYDINTLHDNISKSTWYRFKMKLQIKCKTMNIPLYLAPNRYASYKTCSNCGSMRKLIDPINDTFECEVCGMKIHMGVNAAKVLCFYPKKYCKLMR